MALEPVAAAKLQNPGLHRVISDRFWRTQNGVAFRAKPPGRVHLCRSKKRPSAPRTTGAENDTPKSHISVGMLLQSPKTSRFGNRQKCRSSSSRLRSSKVLDSTPSFRTDFGGRRTESFLWQNPQAGSNFWMSKNVPRHPGQPGPKMTHPKSQISVEMLLHKQIGLGIAKNVAPARRGCEAPKSWTPPCHV